MISHPLRDRQIGLAFECAEFEHGIDRAERNNRRQHKHPAKHHEHDPQPAGHDASKIQIGEQSSDHDPDDTISIGHIAFHLKISFDLFDAHIVGDSWDPVCDKVTQANGLPVLQDPRLRAFPGLLRSTLPWKNPPGCG